MSEIEAHLARTLSHRQLRNDSGRVLRDVEAGQTYVITNRGEPVARLIPYDREQPSLPITRPATEDGGWLAIAAKRKTTEQNLETILNDLRSERL